MDTMTTNKQDAADKALQTWAANQGRNPKIQAFVADPEAPPVMVSVHTDKKSAYTVRTRLQRKWEAHGVVFSVKGGGEDNDDRGYIWISRPEQGAQDDE